MILSIIPARLDGARIGDSVYTRVSSVYAEAGTKVLINEFDALDMSVLVTTLDGTSMRLSPEDLSTKKPFKVGDMVRDDDFPELPVGTTVVEKTMKGIWQVVDNRGGVKTVGNETLYSAEELMGTIIWMPEDLTTTS